MSDDEAGLPPLVVFTVNDTLLHTLLVKVKPAVGLVQASTVITCWEELLVIELVAANEMV